jgi:DNA primase
MAQLHAGWGACQNFAFHLGFNFWENAAGLDFIPEKRPADLTRPRVATIVWRAWTAGRRFFLDWARLPSRIAPFRLPKRNNDESFCLGLIPEDKIAEIRDRTDIVQVIGDYVTLKRSGVNHKGLCPFHQEKSPSFNVNAQKQFFHCFGCGKSGDVISFVSELEGKSFVETVRELARKAGVELPEPPRSPREEERARAQESERAKMVRLHEMVANFYRGQLGASAGEAARAYLQSRGLDEATAEKFRVGYAPAGWEALVRFLESKKVPTDLAERAGLIRRRDNGTHFDTFVHRVVYALTSPMGEVIGFGGRVINAEDQPKYKNSPETLLFKKGENLFGLHLAKHAIRRSGRALVVEGNFDVMTLHQHGVDYAVAPQGTAMTAEQVKLLKRFAREVVLMLDADPAGRAATMKVIHLFVEAELPLRIAQLRARDGKKQDPDELARTDLPRLHQLLDEAQDALEFYFEQVAATSAPTVPGRVAAIEECAPVLRALRDPLARDLYVDKLAQLLKVDLGLVQRAMRAAPAHGPRPRDVAVVTEPAEPVREVTPRHIPLTHSKLLAFLAQHPGFWPRVDASLLKDEAVRGLVASAQASGRFDAPALLTACAPEIRDEVAKALASDQFAGDATPQRAFDSIVTSIRIPSDLPALMQERTAAIARGDRELTEKLNARIIAVRRSSR